MTISFMTLNLLGLKLAINLEKQERNIFQGMLQLSHTKMIL